MPRFLNNPFRWLLLVTVMGAYGCDRPADDDAGGETPAQAASPSAKAPFELAANAEGVLLTWVDEQGRFQLAETRDSIPESARNLVRVVVDGQPTGTAEAVYVADLSEPRARYEVRAMAREQWEQQGAKAREPWLSQVRPGQNEAAAPELNDLKDLGIDAIVYGASWCKPCHQAEDYLKQKGLAVVKKDIEEDPAARKEMQARLAAAGLHGASIPVVYVGGTTMVGFNPQAIDAALARALPED